MTGMDDDNPYPDDTTVLVRFPRSKKEERGDRSAWPWLADVFQQRVGLDEWQVCVEDRAVAAADRGRRSPQTEGRLADTGTERPVALSSRLEPRNATGRSVVVRPPNPPRRIRGAGR